MDYLETDELFNEFNLLKTAMRTLKERYMSSRTLQADKDRLKINIRDTITVTRQQTILTWIFLAFLTDTPPMTLSMVKFSLQW